jgi:TonB-dependent receptor
MSGDYEMVVVSASRDQDQARLQQKNAPNIVNVQSAEEILKFPDFNAAESLSRMPGISLMSDTGEGRFVMIRGIDGNLNGATYGGVVLLNTNPGGTYQSGGGRAVEFDTIPGGAIDGIIVTKTGTPDHDAEGLGGTIELTPRTAANLEKPFAEFSLGGGYEPIHSHGGPYNADIAFGARFGFHDGLVIENGSNSNGVSPGFVSNPTPFSFVVSASWREDKRGFDDIENDPINDPANPTTALYHAYDDLQLRHYDYHRKRFGVGGEFDFKPNDEHRYYFRANMFGYDESVIKNHLVYNGLGKNPATVSGNTLSAQSDLQLKGTNEQEFHRNNVYVLGGEDDFHFVKVDYRAAYSRATFSVGRNYGVTFNGPSGVAINYDNTTDTNFPVLKITDGTNINDPSLYKISKMSNSNERDADTEWSYAGNATVPVDILSSSDSVKFGFSVRLRNKSATPFKQAITLPTKPTLDTLSPLAADTTYYHNRYSNGPGINDGYLVSQIQNGTFVAGPMKQDISTTWSGAENIYAGYVMYNGDYGPWGILAGVRVENTVAKYRWNDDALGAMVMPKNYTDIFPTAQIRYEFSEELIARATYSTGIGRPGFNQVAGASSEDDTTGHITTGNPNLKPITGNNFDLDVEYYLNDAGILELGAFDKEFSNYIFQRQVTVASDPRLPTWTGKVYLDTYDNISSAYVRGIEIAYQQKFTFFPKPLDGFGFEGNYTSVTGSGATRVGEEHALPGTSPTTFNVSLFYEAYGLKLRLASQYVGHSLYQVGGSRAYDQFEDHRFTLDWTSSYELCDNATVYFNVKNITNAPLRIYYYSSNWPIQREFYDQTFEGGVRLKL